MHKHHYKRTFEVFIFEKPKRNYNGKEGGGGGKHSDRSSYAYIHDTHKVHTCILLL